MALAYHDIAKHAWSRCSMNSPSKLVHVNGHASNGAVSVALVKGPCVLSWYALMYVFIINAWSRFSMLAFPKSNAHLWALRNGKLRISKTSFSCYLVWKALGMKCKLSRVTVGINISLNIYITPHLVPSHSHRMSRCTHSKEQAFSCC
jgi:hypothetical protein